MSNQIGNPADAKVDCSKLKIKVQTNKDLIERIERLEERLCISPYGDDNIDQLEEVISYKNKEIDSLKTETYNLREQLKMTHTVCKYTEYGSQRFCGTDRNICKYCEYGWR